MLTKKRLAIMFVPVFLEFLSSTFINAAVSIMVSNVGEYAVSATSMVGSINSIAQLFFAGISAGVIVLVSQYCGAGDRDNCEKVIRQSIALEVIISVVACVFMLIMSGGIMSALFKGADSMVLDTAVMYLRLCVLAYPFLAIYSVANSAMYGAGDFRRTLVNTLLLDLFNIGASAFFIYVFDLGVRGAAYGIIVSRTVCGLLMYVQLRRGTAFVKIRSAITCLEKKVVWSVLRIGIPAAFDSAIVQLSNVILQAFIVKMGNTVLAAYSITMSIYMLPTLFSNCVGSMSITIVGQCYGMGDMKQCRKYMMAMVGFAWGVTILTCLAVFPFLDKIISLYNPEPATFEMVKNTYPCLLWLHILIWAPAWITPSALRACGDARFPAVVSVIAMLVVKLPIVWYLGLYKGFGLHGLWAAVFFEWFFRLLFMVPRIFTDKWHKKA